MYPLQFSRAQRTFPNTEGQITTKNVSRSSSASGNEEPLILYTDEERGREEAQEQREVGRVIVAEPLVSIFVALIEIDKEEEDIQEFGTTQRATDNDEKKTDWMSEEAKFYHLNSQVKNV